MLSLCPPYLWSSYNVKTWECGKCPKKKATGSSKGSFWGDQKGILEKSDCREAWKRKKEFLTYPAIVSQMYGIMVYLVYKRQTHTQTYTHRHRGWLRWFLLPLLFSKILWEILVTSVDQWGHLCVLEYNVSLQKLERWMLLILIRDVATTQRNTLKGSLKLNRNRYLLASSHCS